MLSIYIEYYYTRRLSVTVTVGVVDMGVVDTRYGVSQAGAVAER